MSDFKAKMQLIQFSAGAPPETQLRELTVLPPDLIAGYKRRLLLREEREKKGRRGDVRPTPPILSWLRACSRLVCIDSEVKRSRLQVYQVYCQARVSVQLFITAV